MPRRVSSRRGAAPASQELHTEWITHLGLMYQTDVSWGDVYARADWSWSDDYNTSSSLDPRLVQDSYSWVNARVGTHWRD